MRRTCNSALSSMPDNGKKWVLSAGVLCPSQNYRPSCGRREAIVEYVMDEKASYAIEINRAGLKIHNLAARTEIGDLSRSFVTAIRNGTDSQSSGRENSTSN